MLLNGHEYEPIPGQVCVSCHQELLNFHTTHVPDGDGSADLLITVTCYKCGWPNNMLTMRRKLDMA
jgi:hypothetical protein